MTFEANYFCGLNRRNILGTLCLTILSCDQQQRLNFFLAYINILPSQGSESDESHQFSYFLQYIGSRLRRLTCCK